MAGNLRHRWERGRSHRFRPSEQHLSPLAQPASPRRTVLCSTFAGETSSDQDASNVTRSCGPSFAPEDRLPLGIEVLPAFCVERLKTAPPLARPNCLPTTQRRSLSASAPTRGPSQECVSESVRWPNLNLRVSMTSNGFPSGSTRVTQSNPSRAGWTKVAPSPKSRWTSPSISEE